MPDSLSLMSSLRDVASRISADADIDSLLHALIELTCRHGHWDFGSIMCVDIPHGDALVIARRETALRRQPLEDRWELATSPALVALQRNKPVYIPDAHETTEFIGYRRDALHHGYRTVVVLPMASKDREGRPMVLTVSAQKVVSVSDEALAFMEFAVHLGDIAINRAHRQREQASASEDLRRVLDVQSAMLQEVLAGGSMHTLTQMLADLLDAPVVVVDFSAGVVLASRTPEPALLDADAWYAVLEGESGGALRDTARAAITRNALDKVRFDIRADLCLHGDVEPLLVDGEVVGALLTFGERKPGALQTLAVENAKFAVSVQLMRGVIRFRAETRTLTELFFEIVERRWRDEADVVERARRLGLMLTAATRLVVIDYPHRKDANVDRSAECQRTANMLATQHKLAAHTIMVGGGLVCLVPEDKKQPASTLIGFARQMCKSLTSLVGAEPILIVSEVVSGVDALAKEWDRCWRMIRIARAFSRSGVLSVPDFGPLPMLISAADSVDVRAFMTGTIGAVVEHDRKHRSSYLETLATYIRHNCRSQACADAMDLHVTTLRYRLSRMSDLFGIDVETPERRFSVELALQLHALLESGVSGGVASADMMGN